MKKLILSFISLFTCLNLFFISPAQADVLTPCGKSPAFEKRLKTSLAKLEGRKAKYEPGSFPAIALQDTIDKTKARFDRYGKSNLLCGADGLPHLIADGDWKHAGEFMIPGMMFLYITGWIGWAGRSYLNITLKGDKPTEKEIVIDVPLAIKLMMSAYSWPAAAWNEFTSGKLIAAKKDVTVSPR